MSSIFSHRITFAAGIAGLLAACAGPPTDTPAADSKHPTTTRIDDLTPIVLISIDTLRSDRLPAYGYDRVETPAIDALRADSVLFRHAYTHVPLTLPGHASMLTGRLPYEHGIRDNQGYELDEEWPTLPEILGRRGYRTGAAVSTYILRRETGLARGFEAYEDTMGGGRFNQVGSPQRPGTTTLDSARPWLDQVAASPFFFFFHLYEPHRPYEAPEPFRSRYASPYDAEVARADQVIGELLGLLRAKDLYEGALIILTSDHGEGLGDHGDQEHGPLLYREVLQVPLIIKLPKGARGGDTAERPAQLVDLMPTVLAMLGEPLPDDLSGIPLFDLGEPPRQLYAETLFPRLHFGWSELFSLIEYPYHYIHGPDPELYNLAADPAETTNVLAEQRREFRALEAALERLPIHYTPPGPVDAETREQLAALGYIGGVADDGGDGPRADPKRKLHVLQALGSAFERFHQGDCTGAIRGLEAVLAEEPAIIDAWENLGHCRLRLGDPAGARDAYDRFMKLTGGSSKATLDMAGALFVLGRLDEAREHALLAVPSQPAGFDLLAQIAIRQGDIPAAERAIESALASAIARPGGLLAKATLAITREAPQDALDLAARAEAEAGKIGAGPDALKGIFFVRGQAYARLGEAEKASAAFGAAIERFPFEIAPYTNLALLRGMIGDGEGAIQVLRAMVERIPRADAYAEAVRTLRLLGDETGAEGLLRFAKQRWPNDPALAPL